MSHQYKTVADWLTPEVDDRQTRDLWRRGHHRLQVAVDTIAYSHNVPVRVLLVDRLRKLPEVIAKLLMDDDVVTALKRSAPGITAAQLAQFSARDFLDDLYRTLHAAATGSRDQGRLDGEWLPRAFLALVPYIERKVWLTEIGNPLPVHSLCRMHDLWTLYVLLWAWSHVAELARPNGRIGDVFGVHGLSARTLEAFSIREPEGPPQHAVPIVGPYFEEGTTTEDGGLPHRTEFVALFNRLIESASRSRFVDDPRQDGTPTSDELAEAAKAKVPLSADEAQIRAHSVAVTIDYVRTCEVGEGTTLDDLNRTDWEVVAALCAWLSRWESALARHLKPRRPIVLGHRESSFEIHVSRRLNSRPYQRSLHVEIHLKGRAPAATTRQSVDDFLDQTESTASTQSKKGQKLPSSYRIDRPSRYLARVRERQAAAWSSQLAAINNLLLRHSPRVVEAGPDPFGPYADPSSKGPNTPLEGKHLLRGYGPRVCKHLVSLTRADGASVFWLDYSFSPPRLVRIGDHFRHPAHSAGSLESWAHFDSHVWAPAVESQRLLEVRSRAMEVSQNYRVAYTGHEDPPEAGDSSKVELQEKDGSIESEQDVVDVRGQPANRDELRSYFDCYAQPTPRDSMAVPLLVSGRVIGVLSITGIVPKQFDSSLLWPLRRSAALIAACVSHANEVWHLRRLNYVFAENAITTLHLPMSERGRNPLVDVARCLANIFLCSTANIWIQSASNARRLELAGTSRPELFPVTATLDDSIFEFYYSDPPLTGQDTTRTFSSLALDLWHESVAANAPPIGQFVMAVFDPSVERTDGYDFKTASTRGALLGRDYVQDPRASEQASPFIRKRVFSHERADGHGLSDIMAFALVRPDEGGWAPVGVITLHDEGQIRPSGNGRWRPWDYGWAPVVAQMQTHLPYLFRQAELLFGPETSGRTYVMHALRGELIPLTDRALRLHSRASAIVGRFGSAHDKLKRLPSFDSQSRAQLDLIEQIQSELRDVWTSVEGVVIGATVQRIRFLANVANNYKTLASLVADISKGSDFATVPLRDLLDQLLRDVRTSNTGEQLAVELSVNPDLRVSLPEDWLRMVLRELLRNIEKYSERGPVQIAWSVQGRSIRFVNDCVFDPKTDTPERLMEYRYRGAAARHARPGTEPRTGAVVALSGEGMGLWGIREICDALGVVFGIQIMPKSGSLAQRDDVEPGMALGQFIATLTFPAGVVNADTVVPADNDFN